jgi:hypothetical protein
MAIPKEQLAGLARKQRAYVERVEANIGSMKGVSTGVCPGCEQCRDDYGRRALCNGGEDCTSDLCNGKYHSPTMEEFDEQVSSGRAIDEGSFSWRGCDICGSRLGGTVECWHWIDDNNEIQHESNACTDCVMYLANGDLPDCNDD